MPDLLQILCAYCSGNQILVTWRYLFLRESNNAAQCTGKCPNPQCLSAPRGATRVFATPHLGHVTMPHACSTLALHLGNAPSAALGPPSPHPASHQVGPAQCCPGSTTPGPAPGPQRLGLRRVHNARAGPTPGPHRIHPAPHRVRNIPQYYLGTVPGAQKQNIGSDCNFFAIADCRTASKSRSKL